MNHQRSRTAAHCYGLDQDSTADRLKREITNNFLLVDFSTFKTNNYYCPKKADYVWAFERMQQEKENIQVGWQVLMFTGVIVNVLTCLSSMQELSWLDLP